jgi:hypothetical protein
MRSKAITTRIEEAEEAVVFAEANLPIQTSDASPPSVSEVSALSGKLLVIGNESKFSANVVNYALEMAQRMSYGIVALNTAPLSCDSFKRFSASQKEICQRFQTDSVENVQNFKDAAEGQGITFTHVVKFHEPEKALETVQKEIPNIEFIVSDDQTESTVDRVAEVDRPTSRVYVYSMI